MFTGQISWQTFNTKGTLPEDLMQQPQTNRLELDLCLQTSNRSENAKCMSLMLQAELPVKDNSEN